MAKRGIVFLFYSLAKDAEAHEEQTQDYCICDYHYGPGHAADSFLGKERGTACGRF
ncbi:hypothetical protein D3C75_1336120 [compost metagenome]